MPDVLPLRPVTHLKYAVEVQIPRGTPMLGLLEPLLERVVFEDVPHNLAALKRRVEDAQQRRADEALQRRMASDGAPPGASACTSVVCCLRSCLRTCSILHQAYSTKVRHLKYAKSYRVRSSPCLPVCARKSQRRWQLSCCGSHPCCVSELELFQAARSPRTAAARGRGWATCSATLGCWRRSWSASTAWSACCPAARRCAPPSAATWRRRAAWGSWRQLLRVSRPWLWLCGCMAKAAPP